MTRGEAQSHHDRRTPRWRTKLFGPKILRLRRRVLVRRNVSDVLQTVRSFAELTAAFQYLFFREANVAPRLDVSLFASEASGRKGLDLVGVRVDDGVVFHTAPDSMTAIDGSISCHAIDVNTTEVRLALGFTNPLSGVRALGTPIVKPMLEEVVRDELRRLKQFLETGEIAKAA